MSRKEIEATYAIARRIEAEERALDTAAVVLTSTHQEVKDQWGLYDGCARARTPAARACGRPGHTCARDTRVLATQSPAVAR